MPHMLRRKLALASLSVCALVAAAATSSGRVIPDRQPSRVTAPQQKVIYFGGRVLAHVKIYEVNWGPNVSSTLTSQLPGFYTAITNSVYLDWLSEYDTVGVRAVDGSMGTSQRLGRGSFGGAFTITPSYVSDVIDDNVIQTELAAHLDAGDLPPPDSDTLYMIDFPPGLSVNLYNAGSLAQSCTQFGAYHMAMLYKGHAVAYGVHPDCGVPFTTATSIHAHEMMEAITDPEIGLVDPDFYPGETRPSAWYSFINGVDNGEVADLCEGQGDTTVAGYNVQLIWSNSAGACIGSLSTIICDGASPAIAGCRACTAADDGVACNGERSHCETDSTNAKFGQCVVCTAGAQCAAPNSTCNKSNDDTDDTCIDTAQCSTNAQCSGATPFCDGTTHACRACTAADCSGATPACETLQPNVNWGKCVQCTATNAAACTGATPVCDFYTNKCVGCVTDADCPHNQPICGVPTPHTCRACTSNADCTAGGTCVTTAGDPNLGRCVACTTNAQCTSPAVCGPNNICVLPAAGADAGSGAPDSGADAASGADAGSGGSDSGSSGMDAATPPVDASPVADATTPPPADASTGGAPDASHPAGHDSGAPPQGGGGDGGSGDTGTGDSGGCAVARAGAGGTELPGAAFVGFGLAALAAAARRRRRTRP
jgi:hypothetical protein